MIERTRPLPALDEFALLDACAQGQMVKRGDVSALELVDAAITRIERLNPKVNALASNNYELARERARQVGKEGVFAGVPTLLKDLIAYPGHRAGFGSRLFSAFVAPEGNGYTEALDRAGLVVLGKSTTSEFGLLGTTETMAHGATRNPWNLALSPGGSSGGAVAAVASGMVPVAHASDGGGSIRGPASFTGLFGFKPSRNRTLNAGIPDMVPTARLISDHCVSRSVRDSAAWLAATERPDVAAPLGDLAGLALPADRHLRIGVYRKDCFGREAGNDASLALSATVDLCRALGHDVVDIEGPKFDAQATSEAFFRLTGLVLGGMLAQTRAMMGPAFDESLLEPYTLETTRRAEGLAPDAMARFGAAFDAAEVAAAKCLSGFDILLSPTVPSTALPLGQNLPTANADLLDRFVERVAGFTVVASLAGWPAMSVPLHWTNEDLPIGCHFTAGQGQDGLLFGLALQLEAALPWMPRLKRLMETLAWSRD